MTGERRDVHGVAIREVGQALGVDHGHEEHRIDSERHPRRRPVQGVHLLDAEKVLDPRYGRVVHT